MKARGTWLKALRNFKALDCIFIGLLFGIKKDIIKTGTDNASAAMVIYLLKHVRLKIFQCQQDFGTQKYLTP